MAIILRLLLRQRKRFDAGGRVFDTLPTQPCGQHIHSENTSRDFHAYTLLEKRLNNLMTMERPRNEATTGNTKLKIDVPSV